MIQVSVGNECNFQCTYCNPKFSSKWEDDVRRQSYKVFTDRFFYGIDDTNTDLLNKNLNFLKTKLNSLMIQIIFMITISSFQ